MQGELHSGSPAAHTYGHRDTAWALSVATGSPEVQAHGQGLVLRVQDEVGGKVLLAHLACPKSGLGLLLNRHMLEAGQAMPVDYGNSMGAKVMRAHTWVSTVGREQGPEARL